MAFGEVASELQAEAELEVGFILRNKLQGVLGLVQGCYQCLGKELVTHSTGTQHGGIHKMNGFVTLTHRLHRQNMENNRTTDMKPSRDMCVYAYKHHLPSNKMRPVSYRCWNVWGLKHGKFR